VKPQKSEAKCMMLEEWWSESSDSHFNKRELRLQMDSQESIKSASLGRRAPTGFIDRSQRFDVHFPTRANEHRTAHAHRRRKQIDWQSSAIRSRKREQQKQA
jgi:hypothetical protein